MKVIPWDAFGSAANPLTEPVNLTIGVFDGVHLGHRKLLSEVTGRGGFALVVTFMENPAFTLYSDGFPGSILTFGQKLSRLETLGVDGVLAIDFSRQLSRLSGKVFIGLLREKLLIRKIAVGYNFRFGRDREADAGVLREIFRDSGSEVSVTEPISYMGSAVSSSRIRACIREGALAEAREMLSAGHCIDLRGVETTDTKTVQNRIMRIRRSDIRQCIPETGSYPVSCEAETAAVRGLLTVRRDVVELELESGGKITDATFI